jgi:rhomboid protease GluP
MTPAHDETSGEDRRAMGEVDPFAPPPGFDDDDVPVIDDAMIHSDVDFEAGMSSLPIVSLALMAACALIFGFQLAGGGLENVNRLGEMGALVPDLVRQGEVWRLISATFLHGNFDHLLGNLLILYVLGMACEHGFGRPQFVLLYVASGVVGSLFSLAGGRVSVGASGAIFGLAGALIVLFWRYRGRLHLRDRRIGAVLAVWAVYQFLLGLLNPSVDNLAHFGGLLGGAALGLVLRPVVLDDRKEASAHPLSLAGLVLSCASLAAAAVFFLPRLVR